MKVLSYCRKSSEDKRNQVQSIDDQITWCKEESKHRGFIVDDSFTDEKTGTKPHIRDGFNKMMDIISKEKEKVIILTWELSRLARNPIDGGLIQYYLMQDKIEIYTSTGIYNRFSNQILLGVLFGQSSHYSIDLSRNTLRGLKSKKMAGGCIAQAPIGYINNVISKEVDLDPKRKSYIEKAFRYRIQGYSHKDIAEFLFDEGFRSKKGGKIYKSMIERIIKRKFYCGIIELADGEIKGKHKPIINLDIWEKANSIGRKIEYSNNKGDVEYFFAFKGNLKCGECGSRLTAYRKKGHVYYACPKNKGIPCSQGCIREEQVELLVGKQIENYKIPNELVDVGIQALKDKKEVDAIEREVMKSNLNEAITVLDKKSDNLLDMYLDTKIEKEIYDKKMDQIKSEKIKIQSKLSTLNEKMRLAYDRVIYLFELLKSPSELWKTSSYADRGTLLKIICSNFCIHNRNTHSVEENELFKILKSLIVSYGDILREHFELMKSFIDNISFKQVVLFVHFYANELCKNKEKLLSILTRKQKILYQFIKVA